MAEIVIAKHRNGAVGEVLLRFKGEFTRFSNPEDDMVIPMPGEPAGAMLGCLAIKFPPYRASHYHDHPEISYSIPDGG